MEESFDKVKSFGLLNKEELEIVKSIVLNKKFIKGLVRGNRSNNPDIKTSRSAYVTHLNYNENFVLEKLTLKLVDVVEHFYQYPISNYTEGYQLVKYGIGDFYKKHVDETKNESPKRLLSFILFISDESEYSGGQLRIFDKNKSIRINPIAGSCVIFPSTLLHEVSEITSGTRYVLVKWLKDFSKG